MPPFLCIGHRGAAGHEPENTLRSIRRALELGADGIEIDVRLSLDGHLVVIHDATLGRTTGVKGAVRRKTLSELKSLNAGRGEAIPTLREVLDLIAGRAWLNVELKARGTAHAVSEEIVRAVTERGSAWNFDRLTVSSFDHKELAEVVDTRIPRGVLIARRPLNLLKTVERLGGRSVHISARLAVASRIQQLHEAGLKVFVFTVNDEDEIRRMRTLGIDGVFTDYPERAAGFEEKAQQ